MRREVSISIFAVLIVVAAILTVYYLNVGPTGFAVFSEYTNETSCLTAGYTWENLTEQNCTIKTIDVNGTPTEEETCVNITVGGQCTGDVCGSGNLDLCLNETNCSSAGGYWYNNVCNAEEEQEINLAVSISQPTGEKTSLSGIPLAFAITGGTGINLTCLYNIVYGSPVLNLVSNTSIDCVNGTNTKTFNLVKNGGDNILTIYVNNTSGSASASSGFSVSIPKTQNTTTKEVVKNVSKVPTETETTPAVTQVSLGGVSAQDINQGNSGQFTVPLQNTGTVSVTSCLLKGDDSGWFSITGEAINLNIGGESSLSFSLNVPEAASPGVHTLGLSVDCAEATASQTFTVNVLQKKLNLNITNVQRTREDRVRVDYSLTELAGEDQDVQILFDITDASGLQVANISQNSSIKANQTDDFRVNIPINQSLEGNLTLSAAFNSQVYSSSVLEPITLGAPIGGFAIFAGVGGAGGVIILVVVVLILVVIFFIARKMRQSGKDLGDLFGGSKE